MMNMMKKYLKPIFIVICLMILLAPVAAEAYQSYQTYTYSIDGWYMDSPDAYVPNAEVIDSTTMGLVDGNSGTAMDTPKDLFVDSQNNVYIADAKNNRIVVLNSRFKKRFILDEFENSYGIEDKLSNPSGVYVTDEAIYVADTDNSRIVLFDLDGKFMRIIGAPESSEIPIDEVYRPIALAVDAAGRMYIVSSSTYNGVIAVSKDGTFQGYVGAQKATVSAWDIFWRRFQTEEQRQASLTNVPTEYNNITIDPDGFIYVTTSSIDEISQQNAINGKSKDGSYAPVKKLNTAGDEIMHRYGFFPPSGEVMVKMNNSSDASQIAGPSRIIDVALGPEGTWSIIDEKRQKIFTYDEDGRLLFVFGDQGTQLGNIQSIQSVAYMDTDLLVLDKTSNNITVFRRTEYGNTLIDAIKNQRDRQYDLSEASWVEVLKRNNNFDAAYIGLGRAYYRQGDYEKAMDYYKAAYDTENYSTAFKAYRKDWVATYPYIPVLAVIAVIVLVVLFFRYAGKVNKITATKPGKRTYKEELLFAFHLMMHPFDGFWDLKHERRGSLRGAITIFAIAVLSFYYSGIGTSYLFNPSGGYLNIFGQLSSIGIPVLLWCIANWCLTTLFDGEGSFKDILIATCYSLIPIPLVMIPTTIMTNFLSLTEQQVITMLTALMWIWVGFLVFFGAMVTHDYSLGKNLLTSVGTIVGMVFIMFVALLFSSLLQKIVGFVSNIVVEVSYRL